MSVLKIYDMLGKEVTTLLNEVKKQGTYKMTFDASKFGKWSICI